MADRVNVSVSHLNRLFRAEFGLSPKQYLQQMRLEFAAHLLQTSFLSIKEIRVRVGFTDKTIFVRNFRKLYGAAPRDFRKGRSSGKAGKPPKALQPKNNCNPGERFSPNVPSPIESTKHARFRSILVRTRSGGGQHAMASTRKRLGRIWRKQTAK